MTMLLRGRHTFEVRAGVNLGNSDSRSRSRTQQRIDRTQTLTQMHITDDQRNLGLLAAFDYSLRLSERSRMSFRCGVGYTDGTNAGRQVDTLASTPGLRTRLHDDGRYRHCDIDAGAAITSGPPPRLPLGTIRLHLPARPHGAPRRRLSG